MEVRCHDFARFVATIPANLQHLRQVHASTIDISVHSLLLAAPIAKSVYDSIDSKSLETTLLSETSAARN